MNTEQSLSHTKWEYKYHLTYIPKYRKKELHGGPRKYLGEVFHELVEAGALGSDQVGLWDAAGFKPQLGGV